MLNNYAKLKGRNLGEYTKPEYIASVLRKYGFRDWDSVLAAVGHGGLKEGQVLNKLLDAYDKAHLTELTDKDVLDAATESRAKIQGRKYQDGIVVRGSHDVTVRFAKCCSPIPGDEIVGFVTRGRGVTIQRTDCVNILSIYGADRARLLDAEWQPEQVTGQLFTANITVYANNRVGLVVDISKVLSERKIDVAGMNVSTSKQGTATIAVSFDVHSIEELNYLMEKIRQIESVMDIKRVTGA